MEAGEVDPDRSDDSCADQGGELGCGLKAGLVGVGDYDGAGGFAGERSGEGAPGLGVRHGAGGEAGDGGDAEWGHDGRGGLPVGDAFADEGDRSCGGPPVEVTGDVGHRSGGGAFGLAAPVVSGVVGGGAVGAASGLAPLVEHWGCGDSDGVPAAGRGVADPAAGGVAPEFGEAAGGEFEPPLLGGERPFGCRRPGCGGAAHRCSMSSAIAVRTCSAIDVLRSVAIWWSRSAVGGSMSVAIRTLGAGLRGRVGKIINRCYHVCNCSGERSF